MKYRSTANVSDFLHLFLYGDGGCGKTKAIADFHLASQPIVLVTTETDGAIPLLTRGIDAPVLMPETEDDFVAIVASPSMVVERVIQKMPGFEEYAPRVWAFDGIRSLQRVIFGASARDVRSVLGGAITLPAQEGHGVLGLPGSRTPGVPSNLDYRRLDLNMRNYVGGIEKMPYHTIITAHAERDYAIETKAQLTGDTQIDKLVARNFFTYPSLEGFSLKYDLPALCSSFYLFLEENQNQYTFKARKGADYHARTRVAEVMSPGPVNWTNRNIYELLQGKIREAKEKLSK